MLILTRKIGEEIIVSNFNDDDKCERMSFTVLGIKGNQVRIGCTAKKSIAIHRQEIQDKIDEQDNAQD